MEIESDIATFTSLYILVSGMWIFITVFTAYFLVITLQQSLAQVFIKL
jgi:hypothetical protein